MTEDHINYLKIIGLTNASIERISSIWSMICSVNDMPLVDVFVCDSISPEGVRAQASIFFFSTDYLVECKNFLESVRFDITPYSLGLFWSEFNAVNYDFKAATDESIFTLKCMMRDQFGVSLKAVRNNCPYMLDICKKYFIPST